jgi:hypothetical protein
MKQQESTLFTSFLVLISFCQGHAAIEVQQFWTEPIITWLVIVLPTGEHDFNTLKSQFSFAFKRSHLKAQFSFVFESIRTTLYARRSHSRMITHFHTLFHCSHLKAQCRSHLRAQFSPYISICSLARIQNMGAHKLRGSEAMASPRGIRGMRRIRGRLRGMRGNPLASTDGLYRTFNLNWIKRTFFYCARFECISKLPRNSFIKPYEFV